MRQPTAASAGSGGTFFGRLLAGGFSDVGQARLDRHRLQVADPRRAEDADVGLAVAVPIAGDGLIALLAQLDPQVALVPNAVAVEVEEPQAVDEHADLGRAAAVPIAGDGHRAGHAEVERLDRHAVLVGQNPLRLVQVGAGPGDRIEDAYSAGTWANSSPEASLARLAGVDHAQVPGVSARPAAAAEDRLHDDLGGMR